MVKKTSLTPRQLALEMLIRVVDRGESLSAVSTQLLPRLSDSRDRAFAYRLTLDTLRQLNRLIWLRSQLVTQPLKTRDSDVGLLVLLGIAQLMSTELPQHASLHETVEVAKRLKKPWAVTFINGVLRNFQRQSAALLAEADRDPYLSSTHPKWLVTQLQSAWGEACTHILIGNNTPARVCLRLKPSVSRTEYLQQLSPELAAQPHPSLPQAVLINSTDITKLPLFAEGGFSVQDASAQWAGHLLAPQQGERILDACSAPGGKTTHLLELAQNQLELYALDIDASRLKRVAENLVRLQLTAQLYTANASDREHWWDALGATPFQAILLDAPCSATGIIRRHPDIKWHRKPQDIPVLVQTQQHLLHQLWQSLAPKGRLLYATCSVLPDENHLQIQQFLANTPDASLLPIHIPDGKDTGYGIQLLPSHADAGDGFFYALLSKSGEVR